MYLLVRYFDSSNCDWLHTVHSIGLLVLYIRITCVLPSLSSFHLHCWKSEVHGMTHQFSPTPFVLCFCYLLLSLPESCWFNLLYCHPVISMESSSASCAMQSPFKDVMMLLMIYFVIWYVVCVGSITQLCLMTHMMTQLDLTLTFLIILRSSLENNLMYNSYSYLTCCLSQCCFCVLFLKAKGDI